MVHFTDSVAATLYRENTNLVFILLSLVLSYCSPKKTLSISTLGPEWLCFALEEMIDSKQRR